MVWKFLPILAVLTAVSNISYLYSKEDECWWGKTVASDEAACLPVPDMVTGSERFAISHGVPQHLASMTYDWQRKLKIT